MNEGPPHFRSTDSHPAFLTFVRENSVISEREVHTGQRLETPRESSELLPPVCLYKSFNL